MMEKDVVTKIQHSEDEDDVDFLQLNLLQKVLFWWQDLSQSCGGFFTTTSSSKGSILVTRSFSIYNYIIFRMFYFGDKIFLNHVANFLQLRHLQNVLFWWQDLCQSCGRFSTTKSSSKGYILVTRSFSIMWRIFYNYIIFRMLYFGDKIFLNHVADFLHLHLLQDVLFRIQERVIHRFGNWSSYPPF